MTCRLFKSWRDEVDEAAMHEKRTSEVSLEGETETNRALRREVRKLSEAISKLEWEDKRKHEKRTSEVSSEGESETNKALRREVRKLSEAVS